MPTEHGTRPERILGGKEKEDFERPMERKLGFKIVLIIWNMLKIW